LKQSHKTASQGEPVDATSCPKCHAETLRTAWPYLRGGTGADGETLTWFRCSHCNALFSDLTPVTTTILSLETTDATPV
jgi:DNA-directed RNA polymerase subunit M/transcription elongation factor TFIIS